MAHWKVHTAVHAGPQVAVVRIVQVRALARHTWHHSVGGKTGQAASVAQQLPGHLQYDGVGGELGEYLASGQQAPGETVEVVVLVVLVGELLVLPELAHHDPFVGHLYVLLTEHPLQQNPSRTVCDGMTNFIEIIILGNDPVHHIHVVIGPLQDRRLDVS